MKIAIVDTDLERANSKKDIMSRGNWIGEEFFVIHATSEWSVEYAFHARTVHIVFCHISVDQNLVYQLKKRGLCKPNIAIFKYYETEKDEQICVNFP